MFKQLFIFIFVVALSFSIATPQTHAQSSFADALKRMDVIIAQMQTLRAEFATLSATVGVTTPTPAVQGSVSGGILGNDLSFGATNADIKKIQTLLATDPAIYPYGVASGYFGPKTQEAIRLFQSRFGLDTVGVIGPSTKALLEVFLAAYPAGNYPAGVLAKVIPTVAGASTTAKPASTPASTPQVTTKKLRSIKVSADDGEYIVRSYKVNGDRNRDLIVYPEDFDDFIEMVAKKLSVSELEVRSLVDEDDLDFQTKKKSSSRDADEGDAEDAIDDADSALDDARDEIREADDDGEDTDDAEELYDDARELYQEAKAALNDEEYDDAVDLANEAEELADEAVDELDGSSSSDDVDSIEAKIREDDTDVYVEFENGKDDKFTIEEDDREDIIEAVADELDMSESDVEDMIEFDYGAIDSIFAEVDDGKTRVTVKYSSGYKLQLVINEDDEDDIIQELADELDVDDEDVEDIIEFD